jgi:hypothetical protein
VLREGAAKSLTMPRASNTPVAYSTRVNEWHDYSLGYGRHPFPVDEGLFMFFLQARIEYDRDEGNKAGGLCNRVYAIDLVCSLLGVDGPGKLVPVC